MRDSWWSFLITSSILTEHRWRAAGRACGAVIIPLLFETQAAPLFDAVICVACSEASRWQRLRQRGADAEAVIQKRLSVSRQEIGQWKNFDYLLLSTTIQEDLRRTLAIVEAEKMRSSRVQPPEF